MPNGDRTPAREFFTEGAGAGNSLPEAFLGMILYWKIWASLAAVGVLFGGAVKLHEYGVPEFAIGVVFAAVAITAIDTIDEYDPGGGGD